MATLVVSQRHINQQILDTIRMACFALVEEMPDAKEKYEKHEALVEDIKGKVPHEVYVALSDAFMDAATTYGAEMFRLGLEFGLNPAAMLDLPNSPCGRQRP